MISIVIPAHNEGAVMARTLRAILDGAKPGELEIIVVCNGCNDDTAAVASSFGSPVRVIETPVAGKAIALNLGDQSAGGFPRFYVDADVVLEIDAIRELARSLESEKVLVAAPTGRYDVKGCSWFVRAFFAVRSHLPSAKEGIGGSGVYALSENGRLRFGEFPAVTADDGFVRVQFRPQERKTLPSVYSTVFAPRTLNSLIAQKTRAHYGSYQLQSLFPSLWQNRGESNNRTLLRLFIQPQLWMDLTVYCLVMAFARAQARRRLQGNHFHWEKDRTSRSAS